MNRTRKIKKKRERTPLLSNKHPLNILYYKEIFKTSNQRIKSIRIISKH